MTSSKRPPSHAEAAPTSVAPTADVPSDAASGFDVGDDFERFSQKDGIFCRSFWDPTVHSEKTRIFYETYRSDLKHFRDVEGYTQRDYAFRNASWYVPDIFAERFQSEDRREGVLDPFTTFREGASEKRVVDSPEEMAAEIKRVAKAFGADLVGVTGVDERWLYRELYSANTKQGKPPLDVSGMRHVIVVATSMDHDLIKTVPSALSGAATGFGYAKDSVSLLSIAQYIRNLGYQAIESLNDSALAIPLAIQAGLGEYGRLGLLITKEFGPRVRLGKIFTDLPLAHDRPIRFGVKEFCDVCQACAQACPPKAISIDDPNTKRYNRSNLRGVRKWSVDAERCFGFWTNQNTDCSICIRVCPYNKDLSKWYFRAARWLAGTFLRGFILRLDGFLGYGARFRTQWWWGKRGARSANSE